jgi:hypothetical protein
MIVTKVAFTAFVILALMPLAVAPFYKDFRPKDWRGYDWYDWTCIVCAGGALAAIVVLVLAFVWGI